MTIFAENAYLFACLIGTQFNVDETLSNNKYWNEHFHFKIRKTATFYPKKETWHLNMIFYVLTSNCI